jgi:biotin carboxyl carrier protein
LLYDVSIDGKQYALELRPGAAPNQWLCRVRRPGETEGREYRFDAVYSGDGVLSLLLDGKSYAFQRDPSGQSLVLAGRRYQTELRDPRSLRSRRAAAGSETGPRKITAPMPGKVVRILAAQGAHVEAGRGLLVMEAMKMQNELKSPKAGTVSKIAVREGAAVNAGETLAIVE